MKKRRESLPTDLGDLVDHQLYTRAEVVSVFRVPMSMVRRFEDKGLLQRLDPELVGRVAMYTGAEIKRFADRLAEGAMPTTQAG